MTSNGTGILPQRTVFLTWLFSFGLSLLLLFGVLQMRSLAFGLTCYFLGLPGGVVLLYTTGVHGGGDRFDTILGSVMAVPVNTAYFGVVILFFMRRSARKRALQSIE